MDRRSGSKAAEALKKDWRLWTGVIEAAARGRAAKLYMDPAGYQALYHRLMNVSAELAQSGDESRRGVFEMMETTVRPWLSPRVLEQTDREILTHVLERCRRIERVLEGRTRLSWRAAAPILPFLTVSAVSFVLLWMASTYWSSVVFAIEAGTRVLWASVERMTQVEQLLAVGLVVIIVSIYNVSRAARS